MVAPQTQFEINGGWTSRANETTFWTTVAADTDLAMSTAGTSENGSPIHRLDLGTGTTQTLFITSLIHGNEPATREALMAWLRDLAYSTDPTVTAYLSAHRIVALTPCNPDGFAIGDRENINGVNINRDCYKLAAKETRVLMDTVTLVDPHLVLDVHEYHGASGDADWKYRAGGHPVTYADVRALEADSIADTIAAVSGAGYSTAEYPDSLTPRQGFSFVAGPMHRPGILSETNTAHTVSKRVTINKIALEAVRLWHEDNAAACTAARSASRLAASTSTAPAPLYTAEYFGNDTSPELLDLTGYDIVSGSMPATHAAFGVVVGPDGVASMQQEAQWVIPTLLDSTSPDVVVAATRLARSTPLPTTALIGYKVWAQGKARDVTEIKFHDGTRVQDVLLP